MGWVREMIKTEVIPWRAGDGYERLRPQVNAAALEERDAFEFYNLNIEGKIRCRKPHAIEGSRTPDLRSDASIPI
jgi:hypothetical protein